MEKSKVKSQKSKLKVGIIGCGTIGSEIAKACQTRLKKRFNLIGICDIDRNKAEALQKILGKKIPILKLEDLAKSADLIVEAASAKVSSRVVKKAIEDKKDILVMSVGGIVGSEELLKRARRSGIKVYLPSGAICGIDGIKSASMGRIDSVTLTTRKPPRGLEGAPYLEEKGIDIRDIRAETTLFDGTARDAIKGFPQNVNVSAVLSLAGIGAEKTRVKVITSPDYIDNIHEVEIRGSFGQITTKTVNVPSKTNPKTSELAILSAIATLEGIADSIRIGT